MPPADAAQAAPQGNGGRAKTSAGVAAVVVINSDDAADVNKDPTELSSDAVDAGAGDGVVDGCRGQVLPGFFGVAAIGVAPHKTEDEVHGGAITHR